MSKNVGFPVMSTMITGILFVLGFLLATLGILMGALFYQTAAPYITSTGVLVKGILFFIGLFLFLWAMLSYSLNPDLEDYQRNVAFLFAVLVTVILFAVGISFSVIVP
jgi:hypothetical protein